MDLQQEGRVLIVEDDLALQPFWSVVLKRCFSTWHSDWAVSGEQAENLISKSYTQNLPYQLIISDIFLAGSITGLDLIKHRPQDCQTKFLLVSIADEVRVRSAVTQSRIPNVILTKPLNVPKCERAIFDLLQLPAAAVSV